MANFSLVSILVSLSKCSNHQQEQYRILAGGMDDPVRKSAPPPLEQDRKQAASAAGKDRATARATALRIRAALRPCIRMASVRAKPCPPREQRTTARRPTHATPCHASPPSLTHPVWQGGMASPRPPIIFLLRPPRLRKVYVKITFSRRRSHAITYRGAYGFPFRSV